MKNEKVTVILPDEEGRTRPVEVPLNQWTTDPITGVKAMYTRVKDPVKFCQTHKFNKRHECEVCPFTFVGFRANMHIQTEAGIFERKSKHALGRRLA